MYPTNHKNPLALKSLNSFTSDSNSIISDHSQSIYNNLNHIDNKNEMGTSTNLEHAHRKDNFMHMHHSQDNDKLQNHQNHNLPMTGNDVNTYLKIGETCFFCNFVILTKNTRKNVIIIFIVTSDSTKHIHCMIFFLFNLFFFSFD